MQNMGVWILGEPKKSVTILLLAPQFFFFVLISMKDQLRPTLFYSWTFTQVFSEVLHPAHKDLSMIRIRCFRLSYKSQ
ncbi:hypothetical protein VIGAN_04078900, partial [Vigna angularis var. angularis]